MQLQQELEMRVSAYPPLCLPVLLFPFFPLPNATPIPPCRAERRRRDALHRFRVAAVASFAWTRSRRAANAVHAEGEGKTEEGDAGKRGGRYI